MSRGEIFYGAAIQGEKDRGVRSPIHAALIQEITDQNFSVVYSHTSGKTKEETGQLLEKAIGTLPIGELDRIIVVRNSMISGVEGEIAGAVFEVSTPSHGTGIEFAHAYLRPRLGLQPVPILLLYERDHWPNKLSTMVRGLNPMEFPNVKLCEYQSLDEARSHLRAFLAAIPSSI